MSVLDNFIAKKPFGKDHSFSGFQSTGDTFIHYCSDFNARELIAWWVDDEIFCVVGDISNMQILRSMDRLLHETLDSRITHSRDDDGNDGDYFNFNGVARGYNEVINLTEGTNPCTPAQ